MMSEISLTMQFRKYEIHPSITQGSCIRDCKGTDIWEDLNYMQAINDCLAEAPGELLYLPRNLGTEVMFIEIKV